MEKWVTQRIGRTNSHRGFPVFERGIKSVPIRSSKHTQSGTDQNGKGVAALDIGIV